MTEPPMFDNEDIVRRGRTAVRLIEAVDVLLASATTPNERITYGMARELAVEALREMVRDLEPEITAQIMVANDKRLGTAKDVMLN
jgi:hypothetical protein